MAKEKESHKELCRRVAREGLLDYGIDTTDREHAQIEKATDQALNFFEALLARPVLKPPMDHLKLEKVAPNKRWFFHADKYSITNHGKGKEWWTCVPKKRPELTVGFNGLSLHIMNYDVVHGGNVHDRVIHLMQIRRDPSWHVDQMKRPIPKTLKSMRTNCKYYGLCFGHVEDPVTEHTHEGRIDKHWVRTEYVHDVLRLFKGDVHIHYEKTHVTFYDRWFAVRVPKA